MKKLLNRLISISLLSLLLIGTTGQQVKAQDVDVSYQTFYDDLSPYGQWVSDPQYGNVWVPNEGGDFRPYGSRGHWVMTEYGNTWVSDDPWGWACYHYGRWTYDQYYGWVWIPGYEWAPAWVSWRFGGGYSGWAPLGPGMSVGVAADLPASWWVFVGPQYMYQPNCISYWRGPSYNNTYLRQTTVINNYYVDNRTHVRYNYGPHREAIQQVTHQPVQVYRVQQSNRPGAASVGGGMVSMYRPSVNRGTVGNARPANVMQAPRQISRPQAATNVAPGRSAPFRQEVQQRQAPQGGGQRPGMQPTDRNQPQRNQPMDRNQPQRTQPMNNPEPQRQAPQPMNRPEPQRQAPQPMNRPEPQRQAPQPMNRPEPQRQAPQPMNRPEPQRQAPQPMNRPEPQRQAPQPMNRPEPQRQAPQPMNRPEPQRQMPQPMNRPEPQRQAPQPMNRPEPQRQAPQPMNRPEPQRQMPQPMNRPEPQRQAPQPMNRPEQGQPHEGGGRR